MLAGCQRPVVIQSDRLPERVPEGGWRVTDGFLQERYQIERTLRGQLARCEAERDSAAGRP